MKCGLIIVTFWNHSKSFACLLAFFLFCLASPQETYKFHENKEIDLCSTLCSQCLVRVSKKYLSDKMI